MIRALNWKIAFGLAASLWATPVWSQTQISAPAGWKAQQRANGARTFTPPDLRASEVYNVTVYDSQSLDGKTLEEYLRKFAGPVGTVPGKLGAPLEIKTQQGRIVSGVGIYVGPNNSRLVALFFGTSVDGTNIHVMRILVSNSDMLPRYQDARGALLGALNERAVAEAGGVVLVAPDVVAQKLKSIGGTLKPGVYAGNEYQDQKLSKRLRVYLYPSGEYRVCNEKDEDLGSHGKTNYNPNTGRLDLDWTMGLGFHSDDQFCYFGRDASGKPVIYSESGKPFFLGETKIGYRTRTLLTWLEPPTKRLSPDQESKAKAAAEAEANRFKWVTAPGKGVQNAQIEAILFRADREAKYDGTSHEAAYLLLEDGTVRTGLPPVALDQLDVARSKRNEPGEWGRWRLVKGKYQVAWKGAPYEDLSGEKALPAPAQLKLAGRWSANRATYTGVSGSYSEWGVTLDKKGRFKRDSNGGGFSSTGTGDYGTNSVSRYDDEGSSTSVSVPGAMMGAQSKKRNSNGDREGTYSLNGYTLTLRYDNGRVERLPFFFTDAKRTGLWFDGAAMF